MTHDYDTPRWRVWPDGTVQDEDDAPHSWMSDDYMLVYAETEDDAREQALTRGNNQ